MVVKGYDFAGWATKNDIRCADGVVIKHGAFKDNDQMQVPLVWNHNHTSPNNVLGHVLLHNQEEGVYAYGFFNEGAEARDAKELLSHGDINAMSIGAKGIQKRGADIIHGLIYEVSLVLSAANPGAMIESVIAHSTDGTESAVIYTGKLIHSADDELVTHADAPEKTIGDVLETLTDEQMTAVETLIANVLDDEDDDEDEIEQSDVTSQNKGANHMKQNVFSTAAAAPGTVITTAKGETLEHSDLQAAVLADGPKAGTLKESMLQHGITNIEILFPDATVVSGAPFLYKDKRTAGAEIVGACHKSPFSRVKTIIADLTADTARARGYIKGTEKLEQVFDILTRQTTPQTIYKKQKLDRDDLIDIVDYNVVGFLNMEMKMMLIEELGRAIMVGDGRAVNDPSKIKSANIRPIITDDALYCIKKTISTVGGLNDVTIIEAVIKALGEYEGTGTPTMYCHPGMVADLRLLRADDGRFLFGDIPSKEAIATRLGVAAIVESTFFGTDEFVLVNLSDYTLGSTKGGEVTTFNDFDIDYNQEKYLIETRVSGALTIPKSAIHFKVKAAVTGP